MLYIGEEVGTGEGPAVDIALDPLEGTTLTAKDMPNALTVIAMGPRGSMLHAPDVYMEKLAIGPGFPEDVVTLDMTPTERVEALKIGVPDASHSFDIGSMTTARQVKTVEAHISDAVEKGARIQARAEAPEQGCFAPATVLVDVDHSMQVMQEETFGPVVAVMKVKSMEEAIAFASSTQEGNIEPIDLREEEKERAKGQWRSTMGTSLKGFITAFVILFMLMIIAQRMGLISY